MGKVGCLCSLVVCLCYGDNYIGFLVVARAGEGELCKVVVEFRLFRMEFRVLGWGFGWYERRLAFINMCYWLRFCIFIFVMEECIKIKIYNN